MRNISLPDFYLNACPPSSALILFILFILKILLQTDENSPGTFPLTHKTIFAKLKQHAIQEKFLCRRLW